MTDLRKPIPLAEVHLPEGDVRMFPALKMLERQTPPLRHGHEPYWRAPAPDCAKNVYIPAWNWTSPHDVPTGTEILTLDANAAYLAAAGGVDIAFSELRHTGPLQDNPEPRRVPPGYYRIVTPHWAFPGTIVSPLGDSSRLQTESTLWIAAPTLVLLLELETDGHLGQVKIIDSYTTGAKTNLQSWVARLKSVRIECLDRIDAAHNRAPRPADCKCPACSRYNALKEGYSSALSMMLTGRRCKTHRPDWAHTVYAQHAASQWRKAWRYTYTGSLLVSMGHVDEITILPKDLHDVLSLAKPPFRYDDTGRAPGAMKTKHLGPLGPSVAIEDRDTPAVPADGDDWFEDVL